jgi:hypothetical protein
MSGSDAGDTLHAYFSPSDSPKSKRAKAGGREAWHDLAMADASHLDSSDDEESLAKRSVRSGIASSVDTLRAVDGAVLPNWVWHDSNVWDFCVSAWRFYVMTTLRERRLLRQHSASNPVGKKRARSAAAAPAPAPAQGANFIDLSDDEDSDDEGVECVLPVRHPLGGGASGVGPSGGGDRAAAAAAAAATAATAAAAAAADMPTVVEEDEADTSLVVDLYDSPLAALAPEHPSPLCFSATLEYARPAALDPDDTDGLFSPFLLEKQVLSSAQLHSVALAMKAFARGRAFLVGDGTGVGKGRESMGVIMSHWHQSGSRRALIVSTGSLATDVRRDFDDCRIAEAFPGTKFIDASKALPKPGEVGKRAVIFTTYSQIRSPRKGYGPYAELIKARGGRPAGTLVLDEVHKGTKDRTNATYKQVEQLVEAAADSPLLCMSATFAADIEGLRLLAPRLGLVGEGDHCAFPSFGDLKTALHSHKATGLELLTAQLSHEGLFLARVISYHGTRADHLSCAMTAEHEQLYTACSRIYADLWATGLYDPMYPKGYYVGSKVRFFKTLTLLAKLKDVVDRVRAELAEGRQVVVTVLGTSEAALKRADPDEIEQSGGVSALRDEVLGTIQYGRDKCGASLTQLAKLDVIAARVEQLNLSRCGALDLFKHELREFGVAELTGRTNELRWDAARKGWFPRRLSNDIVAARRRFQRGSCKVALVSGAASTGISLHDDGSAEDGLSHPRTMVLFELPWSASAALQLLGRVHRSAQLSQPLFVTTAITTAEQRFSAAVSQRLRQLGALTTGDQRDDGGSRIALEGEVLLSAAGNRAAKLVADLNGISVRKEAAGRQLLNFALGMPPRDSEAVIGQFFDCTASEHAKDVAFQRVPPPRATLKEDGDKTVLLETLVPRPGLELTKWTLDRRLTWEDVCAKKAEFETLGRCTTGFATSIASDFDGLCLCHYRDGYVMARCHFIDGRIALVHPDKLVTYQQSVEARWRNSYNHTNRLSVTLSMVPCLEALSALSRPPKTYRAEFADGRRQLGIFVPETLVRLLRRPPATQPAQALP